jgi:hypothetical protein
MLIKNWIRFKPYDYHTLEYLYLNDTQKKVSRNN